MTLSRRAALIGLTTTIAAAPSLAHAAVKVITGRVSYRERIALPPKAILEVSLVDVSLADAPAKTLSRTTVRTGGRVPIPYRLRINAAAIRPGHRYALQARITVDGRLMFLTTTHHGIFGDGPNQTDIMVQRVAGLSEPKTTGATGKGPAGRWLAEDIEGGGVIDRLQSVLELGPDGAVSGTGGCNRMTGQAKIAGNSIAFGNIAATLMACTPAAMNQERKFFAALGRAKTWQIDEARGKMTLADAGGRRLVVFSRM